MYRKIFVSSAAAAIAVSSAGLAMAAGGSASPQAGGPTAHGKSLARTASSITTCNGGRQKSTQTKINNQYSTFGEGADFDVPGTITVKGPRKGKDTLNIDFSAETQLRGGSAGDLYDWIELEVLVDGTPVQPFDGSSPLGFAGSGHYNSNAAGFCTKVGRGWHTVSVRTRLVDNGTDDNLTGWIDDTTLHVVKSE